jgi:hypothetical protein
MKFLCTVIVAVVFFYSCSSPPTIIERPVIIEVPVPAIKDSLIVLKDTVIVQDSVWFGEVKDSLGKVIGDLTVFFQRKIASLNIKRDTISVVHVIRDTVYKDYHPLIPIADNLLSKTEKALLYGGLGLLLSLIVYLRVKRIV